MYQAFCAGFRFHSNSVFISIEPVAIEQIENVKFKIESL